MLRPTKMDAAALKGYSGEPNDSFLPTSPVWYAYCLGKHFLQTGRGEPRDVRMGRGYSIWMNDMRFVARLTGKADNQGTAIEFERVE